MGLFEEKKRAIAEAEEKIEVLKADIQAATAKAAKLTKERCGNHMKNADFGIIMLKTL